MNIGQTRDRAKHRHIERLREHAGASRYTIGQRLATFLKSPPIRRAASSLTVCVWYYLYGKLARSRERTTLNESRDGRRRERKRDTPDRGYIQSFPSLETDRDRGRSVRSVSNADLHRYKCTRIETPESSSRRISLSLLCFRRGLVANLSVVISSKICFPIQEIARLRRYTYIVWIFFSRDFLVGRSIRLINI